MIITIPEDSIQQGSDEWLLLRSSFISGTDAYELLKGVPIPDLLEKKKNSSFTGNYYTERGHIYEQEAKELYSELICPIENVGFVINNKYKYVGVSPDGVAKDHLVEVKAFLKEKHLKTYENKQLEPHINAQIQYQLFVTEKPYCHLLLYNPDLKDLSKAFLLRTVTPDEKIQRQFQKIFSSYRGDI